MAILTATASLVGAGSLSATPVATHAAAAVLSGTASQHSVPTHIVLPHRYWRIKVTDNNGSGTYTDWSQIELYNELYSNVASEDIATLTDATFYTGDLSRLFDGDSENEVIFYMPPSPFPFYVTFDFGSDQELTGFMVASKAEFGNDTRIKDYDFEYSDNGWEWITIASYSEDYSGGSSDEVIERTHGMYGDFPAGAVTLPSLTISATGSIAPVGSAAVTLPSLTVSANGTNDTIDLPALTLTASGYTGNITNEWQDDLTFSVPLSVEGTMLNGGVSEADVTLPGLSLSAYGNRGAAITLPSLTLASTGKSGDTGNSILFLPRIKLVATGQTENISTYAVTLPILKVAATGINGASGSLNQQLGMLALAAEGYTGAVNTATITLPVLELSADGHGEYVGTASIELPMLTLESTTDVAITGNTIGYVLNTMNKALTRYTGVSFNSLTEFNGVYLGANDSGVFLLSGDTDDGTNIDSIATLGKHDFDNSQLKRVTDAYVGSTTVGELVLKLQADDGAAHEYTLTPTGQSGIHTTKVKTGRGVKGRYWQPEFRNRNGSDFDIEDIELSIKVLGRKS
jgi:hypothetical protein